MQRLTIEIIHLFAQFGAPFGDGARGIYIDHHCQCGRSDQFPAEIEIEDHPHRDQLNRGRGDVEQQEIEHHVDALGAAFDDFCDLAGAPGQVKPQGQAVEPVKHIFSQAQGGHLSDPFEHDIAQIVEQERCEPAQDIGRDQSHCDFGAGGDLVGGGGLFHRIDRAAIGKGQRQSCGLGSKDKRHCHKDPNLQLAIIARPKIGQEPLERVPAISLRLGIG